MQVGFKDEQTWESDADLAAHAHSTKSLKGRAFLMLAYSSLGVVYGEQQGQPGRRRRTAQRGVWDKGERTGTVFACACVRA